MKTLLNKIRTNKITNKYIMQIFDNYLQISYMVCTNGILELEKFFNEDSTNNYDKGLYSIFCCSEIESMIEYELPFYIFSNYESAILQLINIDNFIKNIINIINKYIIINNKIKKHIKKEIYKHYIKSIIYESITLLYYTNKNKEDINKCLMIKEKCFTEGKLKEPLNQYLNNKKINVNTIENNLFNYIINNYKKININIYFKNIFNICKHFNVNFNDSEQESIKNEFISYIK